MVVSLPWGKSNPFDSDTFMAQVKRFVCSCYLGGLYFSVSLGLFGLDIAMFSHFSSSPLCKEGSIAGFNFQKDIFKSYAHTHTDDSLQTGFQITGLYWIVPKRGGGGGSTSLIPDVS